MHLSVSSPRGGGEGGGHKVGILTFLKKIIKILTPGRKRIVKISRNKWFTSLVLYKIERSNAWCPIKIPTLGIYVTVKFPWFAWPPPPHRAWPWYLDEKLDIYNMLVKFLLLSHIFLSNLSKDYKARRCLTELMDCVVRYFGRVRNYCKLKGTWK